VKAHPYADLFPLMADDELRRLADDIAANGQREPIYTIAGAVLDGRNRLKACRLAGAEPRFEEYAGGDPLGFVISKNLHRRHLSESQRAVVAAELANLKSGNPNLSNSADLPNCEPPVSQAKAAELLNVGKRTVGNAKRVLEAGVPELADAVKRGEVTVDAAAEVAKLPKAEQRKVVKKGAGAVKEKAAEQRKARAKPDPDDGQRAVVVIPPQVKSPPSADAWGIPVQPHAAEAFAALPKFAELVAAISSAQRLFNEVANTPGGRFLTLPDVSSYRRGKRADDGTHADRFVHEGLETALRQVKAARPTHTVCPWNYVEAPHPDDCPTCKGLNWTPELSKSIPDEAVRKAKEAFGV